MSRQESVGNWIKSSGQLLLFAVFVFCCFDVWGFSSRGHLIGSLPGYLTPIFGGVALQFIGSAVSQMRFKKPAKGK